MIRAPPSEEGTIRSDDDTGRAWPPPERSADHRAPLRTRAPVRRRDRPGLAQLLGGTAAHRADPRRSAPPVVGATATEATRLVVAALAARQAEVADQLADAVAEITPEAWRSVIDAECRPLAHSLLPAMLACLGENAPLNPELLDAVRDSAASYPARGIPAGVAIRSIQAGLMRFNVLAHEDADRVGVGHHQATAGLVLLTSRAPLIILEVVNAFVAGYLRGQAADREQVEPPAWWLTTSALGRSSLRLAVDGLTNAQIAAQLQCSPQAVNYHLRAMMRHLAAPNRTALAARARAAGLLHDG